MQKMNLGMRLILEGQIKMGLRIMPDSQANACLAMGSTTVEKLSDEELMQLGILLALELECEKR